MPKLVRKRFGLFCLATFMCSTCPALPLPALQAAPPAPTFAFDPKRPRLVVLLHGVTPKVSEDLEAGIASSLHTRYYWGPRFIQALTGYPDHETMKVVQPIVGGGLSIRTIKPDDWHEAAPPDARTSNLAPIVIHSPLSTAGIEGNKKEIETQIRLLTKPSSNPPTQVMVHFRDGSPHLMPQVGATIDQVYDTYQAVYGKLPINAQPQIYMVGHSFGGVVARAIFANPTGADLWGNKLSPLHRQRADFLRSRTVLLFTLSSPHRGTHIGDSAGDFAGFVRRAGGWTIASLGGLDKILATEPLSRLDVETKFAEAARNGLQSALNAISGERDCLQDLLRQEEYNQGILNPNTAKRADNGSVIPIYTAAGRNPGDVYFDRNRGPFIPNLRTLPNSILDIFQCGRMGKQSAQLYLIQSVLHREGYGYAGKMPWGVAKSAVADRMTSPFKGIGPAQPRRLSDGITPTASLIAGVLYDGLRGNPYTHGPDGENDSDGFLGFDSAHGMGLTGGAWYRLYDQSQHGDLMPWDIDNHGSLMFNVGNGLYIHNLLREAGPVASPGRVSVWPGKPAAPVAKKSVTVEIVEIHDVDNKLDTVTAADFSVYVRIAGRLYSKHAPDDTRTPKNVATFTRSDLVQSVVPIAIGVIERDTPDPDDYCTVNKFNGRDTVYFYYDTRTKQIWGDENGTSGVVISSLGRSGKDNRASIKIKITGS